jgi:hypothetical protein
LAKHLLGKLFADKGYIGKAGPEAATPWPGPLYWMRKHIKSLPLAMPDKLLLNARSMAETISSNSRSFLCSICPGTACRSMPFFTSRLPFLPNSHRPKCIRLQSPPKTHYRVR